MNTLEPISIPQLLVVFVPAALVLGLMWHWGLAFRNAGYALMRMLAQLLLIGYVLIFIFRAESSPVVLVALLVMVVASSWIALNAVGASKTSLYLPSLLAILLGGGSVLALVTQGVLQLDPWYKPQYMIPLAGMIFANAMTSVSLAAERLFAELQQGASYENARRTAFRTAMIPMVNSLFAVGLVSLPGMMTGQILAGVSPFIAARYQIMVMCMLFASAGFAAACFLWLLEKLGAQDAVTGPRP